MFISSPYFFFLQLSIILLFVNSLSTTDSPIHFKIIFLGNSHLLFIFLGKFTSSIYFPTLFIKKSTLKCHFLKSQCIYLFNKYASSESSLVFCVQVGPRENDMKWIPISLFPAENFESKDFEFYLNPPEINFLLCIWKEKLSTFLLNGLV